MTIKPLKNISGAFDLPGDKSITHRAIMLNAIAEGEAKVYNALLGDDCLATIECMAKLGARISIEPDYIAVAGAKKIKNSQELFVGNSGTTIRLLTGLLCGAGVSAELDGDESIRKRPMNRIIEPLGMMGAKITASEGGYAPLKIKSASLKGIEYKMSIASAQVKSCLLLAGLFADGPTTIIEPVKTRNHTELMLTAMSADIITRRNKIIISKSKLKSIDVYVPGDISSAAYLMVLATILPDSYIVLKNVGVNPTRTGILDILKICGAKITMLNRRTTSEEPVSDMLIQSADEIKPFVIGGDLIPRLIDEIPILAVLACFADGQSVIKDAQELKVKESNRIDTTVNMLKKMGARIEATNDGMIINGSGALMGGVEIDAGLDHRLAMCAAVAGAVSLDGVKIKNAQIADVSYPGFYKIFERGEQ
ncbi:MAG: 3-phosphoshikimate 1-carboxyvinyltransferase [Clostridiales bacterium]|nr:3-phosphoshikimate 1-carboxyvinyltransferase [Clostridiales bacterium]